MSEIPENPYIFSSAVCVSEISCPTSPDHCVRPSTYPDNFVGRSAGTRGTQTSKNMPSVSKVYKRTTHYNNLDMPKKDIICFDDSNACGEYFSLDLDIWEELEYSIDEHKRINVGRQRARNEVRLFIQTNETGEFKTVDNIILFSRAGWSELRRVRGKDRGLPLEVNANGTIWIGDRAEFGNIKIFTMKV